LSNERSTKAVPSSLRKFVPQSRVSQRKLQRILHQAAQVFSEKGYEGASIRDISRSSGISLAGLYYYIESKQKLLYLIQLYTFQTVLARLEKRLSGVRDPSERLQILVRNHLDYFLRHPVEMKVLSHEDEALEGEYRKEILEIKRRYYDIALNIFEDMRRSGFARRLNPRVAVLALFGMMNWIYTWHRPTIDLQADALADAMAGIFLHGVENGNSISRQAPRVSPMRKLVVAARAAR
jgi:TetR/AcrR family transcriptional regulator, cholesterol catabolism regulator